jgi:hypothetical protein
MASIFAGARTGLFFFVVLLSGCAGRPYIVTTPEDADFLDRRITQENGPVSVSVAVPDAAETVALTGFPLYDQGIQPVWLEVTNTSADLVRLSLWSIDPDYYSPLEVAWMNRGGLSSEGEAAMNRWFYENAIDRRIPPGASRSGLVYTNLVPGTKGFNVDVFSPSDVDVYSFTFFVPLPGFTADYMQVDFAGLYEDDEIQALTGEELRIRIREEPCCATDATGTKRGDPFNMVIAASSTALRRALLRGGWLETEAGADETGVARLQHYRGRRPDGTFVKARSDGTERMELRLWVTPYVSEGDPIWVGQVLYDLGGKVERFGDLRLDPDIDAARDALLQDFWYNQSIRQGAYTKAFDAVPESDPVTTFTGSTYFTSGYCAVVWLSEEPVALDDIELLGWSAGTGGP